MVERTRADDQAAFAELVHRFQAMAYGYACSILAEWYVAESGRAILFRRYNSPGWRKPGANGSFESLTGNLEVEYERHWFRHWYDCIPDHALESALL